MRERQTSCLGGRGPRWAPQAVWRGSAGASRPRTIVRARQRARERASAEGSFANDHGQAAFERAGAAASQAAFGAAGFRPPTDRLRLMRPSDARSAQRGADASPAARAPQAVERAGAAAC